MSRNRIQWSLVAFALASQFTSAALHAQEAPKGTIARTFEIKPNAAFIKQFEEGYRRHLDWHRGVGETWAWYLWEVTNGERADLYVDGTFAHSWGDFDHSVDPPGDAANGDLNVEPFAMRPGNQVWRQRPDLSGISVDPEQAELVLHTEYHVKAGAESSFLTAVRRFHEAEAGRKYSVFELASGGAPSTFVLWMPARDWSELGSVADGASPMMAALAADADLVRSEIWRFRPDLSLCKRAASKCHATLR